eukprot:558017-Heterocapsa_arctica.AAC.1
MEIARSKENDKTQLGQRSEHWLQHQRKLNNRLRSLLKINMLGTQYSILQQEEQFTKESIVTYGIESRNTCIN